MTRLASFGQFRRAPSRTSKTKAIRSDLARADEETAVEVTELRIEIVVQQDILRLQIAVNTALVVKPSERIG